ncbi:MAG: SPOR domain-containing protein [Steroidobacteraceae bacterium]
MSPLTTRDYKGAGRREGAPSGGLKEFLWGALAGALLAGIGTALVMQHMRRAGSACASGTTAPSAAAPAATVPPTTAPPTTAQAHFAPPPASHESHATPSRRATVAPERRTAPPVVAQAAVHGTSSPAQPQYDFYQMLPNLKVIVPRPSAPGAHAAGMRGAGAYGGYVLQVGSYSSPAQAERIISELDSVGIIGHVDTVQSRGVTLHRVRVGPITEASELARIRSTLHAMRLPAIVIPGAVH